jgi:hypothetical protein
LSNYKVEFVEIRKKKGKDFLHIKIHDKMVGFFEEEDVSVEVKEGDIISCDINQKGKFLNGSNLKIIDKDTADIVIEEHLIVEHKQYDNDSKLHAGPRIYHFEIKKTSRGDKYLVITEQSGNKKNRIFIFDDHAESFSQKLAINLEKLK